MLYNWINPKSSSLFVERLRTEGYSCFKSLHDETGNIDRNKVAIIGFGNEILQIRKKFYDFDFSAFDITIFDLGDIRNNDISLMTAAYVEMISQGIFPIVLDPSINTSISVANSLKSEKILNNHGIVTSKTNSKSIGFELLSKLVEDQKVNLLSIIGYQKHYANPSSQSIPNIDLAGIMSLGKLRDDFNKAEPILRDLTTLSFDTSSIRASDSLGLKGQNSVGLTSEEACKLLQYATSSRKLKSLHITGYEFEESGSRVASELIACLIWYSIAGRQVLESTPTSTSKMDKYIVELSEISDKVKFWKNQNSERWWVEIPNQERELNLIPCSEDEYKLACENKISDRLFHLLANR